MDKYAVIGNPIEHSLSPHLHSIFARRTGQNLSYEKVLAPLDGFRDAAEAFRLVGGKGLNVTVPFKAEAFSYVSRLSAAAQMAHAVNTIIFKDNGVIEGHNTDGIGLVRDLTQNLNIELKAKKILLLGAGGATRGCLLPILQSNPASVTICNRDINKAQSLINDFASYKNISYCSYTDLDTTFDLIINGTSASLTAALPPLSTNVLHKLTCCYDMAYGEQPTVFQQWAIEHGCKKSFDGIGMLIEQGAESFYLWRGIRPDTTGIAARLLA